MAPAAAVMEEALRSVPLKSPSVPLVANVVAGPVTDPEDIRRRLVEQVTGMVRWRESMAWLGNAGVTRFVELGAGKVLSGLAKRIVDGAETIAVGVPEDVPAAVERLSR
jgi:[acyl-carrier-protein] S-malonyltransferase